MTTRNDAGIELFYETRGDAAGVPILLIMGLGAQYFGWDDEFTDLIVDRGAYVIRFDNRDTGESTRSAPDFDVASAFGAYFSGTSVPVPYQLADMADDAAGLLDHLGLDSAHIVGASMGGMIAQALVIAHPARARSLTSIMSTTGDPDVGQPTPEVMPMLLQAPPEDREGAIEQGVAAGRLVGAGDGAFDEDRARRRAAQAYDRAHYPRGTAIQLLATATSPSRTEALGSVTVPTVVIHGSADPLIGPSGGERTAEAIPGARLELIKGMGHDLPAQHWDEVVDLIWSVVDAGEARLAAASASDPSVA